MGRGPARVRSVARVGLLPLLALPVWLVHLPLFRLHLQMLVIQLVRCLLPLLDVLVWVLVAQRVTARHLIVTAPLSLGLLDRFRDRGPRQVLPGLALSMVVNLPPLLRARRKMTSLVLFDSSICIRTIRSGLCFASSGITAVWRNRQV